MTEPSVVTAAPRVPPPRLRRAWEQASSRCIKCGFCLPACPTYRETGREASSPRGRLDLMDAAARGLVALAEMEHELWLCLGCLACETACPSGIRFHDLLEAARADSAAAHAASSLGSSTVGGLGRLLLKHVLVSPLALKGVVWGLYLYQRLGVSRLVRASRVLAWLSPRLALLEQRMPPLARPVGWRNSLRQPVAAIRPGESESVGAGPGTRPATAGTVQLLSGCVMDAAFGEVHRATVRVLARNGIATGVPAAQACCGALHLHAGETAQAQALARRNIAAFDAGEAADAPVLVNAAGCGAMLKQYGHLLSDDAVWAERARNFSARVQDVCEFLAQVPLQAPTRAVPLRVAYDDACHLLHAQGIREQPRRLLGAIPGLTLVPLREAEMCCGSAGSYSLTEPEMALRLLNRKLEHLLASGAEVVATGNPGCLLQLRLGAHLRRLPLRVVHPVQLLAEAYGEG